jgi:prepilin-type N-terminal cleavage/methylation domain-containing protein
MMKAWVGKPPAVGSACQAKSCKSMMSDPRSLAVVRAGTRRAATGSGGFTILEMAIVLAIIALIAGGIFIAQSMIRNSQLQAVAGELMRYTQALGDFRDKYHALPGDFAGAEALWGSDASCPNTPISTTPHKATCNGNGDGHIGYYNSAADCSQAYEFYRSWQQLADAGMIDGVYTGMSTNPNPCIYHSVPGVNVPASKLPGAGYSLEYWILPHGNLEAFPALYNHTIQFGTPSPTYDTFKAALSPSEMLAFDTKLDDGLPASGKILGFPGPANPNCLTSNTAAVSRYNTNYSGVACGFLYITGF